MHDIDQNTLLTPSKKTKTRYAYTPSHWCHILESRTWHSEDQHCHSQQHSEEECSLHIQNKMWSTINVVYNEEQCCNPKQWKILLICIFAIQTWSLHTINWEFGFVTFCEKSFPVEYFLRIEWLWKCTLLTTQMRIFCEISFYSFTRLWNIPTTIIFPFMVWYNTRYFNSVWVIN